LSQNKRIQIFLFLNKRLDGEHFEFEQSLKPDPFLKIKNFLAQNHKVKALQLNIFDRWGWKSSNCF
jgi:hypothetical protein